MNWKPTLFPRNAGRSFNSTTVLYSFFSRYSLSTVRSDLSEYTVGISSHSDIL